jgi:hypothetical protein
VIDNQGGEIFLEPESDWTDSDEPEIKRSKNDSESEYTEMVLGFDNCVDKWRNIVSEKNLAILCARS